MTKLRHCRLTTFVVAQSQNGSALGRLRLPTVVCIFLLFCAAAVIASPAQNFFFTSLASFDGTDGLNPRAALVQDSDGNFYGTTEGGGAYSSGTVFKVTAGGTLTILYSFCAQPHCSDGFDPYGGLVQAADGNFYGTTYGGGHFFPDCLSSGCGTVFKITPAGTLTTLHSFDGTGGALPYASLVQASDGNFYGTSYQGGINDTCPYRNQGGCGTVFKITPGGTLTTLYSFCALAGCVDGDFPVGGLVQGSDGDLYGTTGNGGTNDNCNGSGCGTVFKITLGGTLTTLYSFCPLAGCADGMAPYAGLVQATDGSFYGTTYGGGVDGGGTVFKINAGGTLATLHSFDGADGDQIWAGLVQATDGNFYGTTTGGGNDTCFSGCGTIFKITAGGALTTLHSFDGGDGNWPIGGLVQASNGNFYGTTYAGGAYGVGTVFRVGVVRPCLVCHP
jgi:uncharacterized repeat protein (TIGR03803 family)